MAAKNHDGFSLKNVQKNLLNLLIKVVFSHLLKQAYSKFQGAHKNEVTPQKLQTTASDKLAGA